MTHFTYILLLSLQCLFPGEFFLLFSSIVGYRTDLLVQLSHHLQGLDDLIVLVHGRFLVSVEFATIFDNVPVRLKSSL